MQCVSTYVPAAWICWQRAGRHFALPLGLPGLPLVYRRASAEVINRARSEMMKGGVKGLGNSEGCPFPCFARSRLGAFAQGAIHREQGLAPCLAQGVQAPPVYPYLVWSGGACRELPGGGANPPCFARFSVRWTPKFASAGQDPDSKLEVTGSARMDGIHTR